MVTGSQPPQTQTTTDQGGWLKYWYRQRNLAFMLLAANRGLALLAALGLLSGLAVGALMVGIEWAIGQLQLVYGLSTSDQFVTLGIEARIAAPLLTALVLGLIFSLLRPHQREIGVTHVIERMERHDAHMPATNACVQGLGAVAAVAGGFSVGREGPGVHLGAALASFGSNRLGLPANATRILVACGAAAAIAASFNTPLAGVIFAMEVILMEYSLSGFAPIMLAAVSATTVSRLAHGTAVTFAVPNFTLVSLAELPWLVLIGLLIGILATVYLRLIDRFMSYARHRRPFIPFAIAGLITAGCGYLAPESLGIGYAVTNQALIGEITLAAALLILGAKLFASAAAVGLGIPGGLIGPTIVMGAMAGLLLGQAGAYIAPTETSPLAFYALIGMGTMMGATLQAPLAALIAMLELTGNPNIILPGMLALMTAFMTNLIVFRQQPVFLHLLSRMGKAVKHDPRVGALQQTTVAASVNTSVSENNANPTIAELRQTMQNSTWLFITGQQRLIRSKELKDWLERKDYTARDEIDLMLAPVAHLKCTAIDAGASLYKALLQLRANQADALIALRPGRDGPRLFGVLTEDAITGKLIL